MNNFLCSHLRLIHRIGKTSVVSARLPDEMIAELDNIAQKTGRTRNELIQMSIDYALKNLEIED